MGFQYTGVLLLLLNSYIIHGQEESIVSGGILYPRESESREVKKLDGIWNFRLSPQMDQETGFRDEWYKQTLAQTGSVIPMPVPSSYNDITQNSTIRDYVGWAWYDRQFYVPKRWQTDNQKVFLRFSSAHYNTEVWVNGQSAMRHSGGHLPFVTDVSHLLNYDGINLITASVNNTLTAHTIPQGSIVEHINSPSYPPDYYTQSYSFDFFNYAGIHRSVHLYTTPQTHVDDITIVTGINGTTGTVNYDVDLLYSSGIEDAACSVIILDKNRNELATSDTCTGVINIPNANFWWPYQMDPNNSTYLYTFQVTSTDSNNTQDIYRLDFGIRTINWDNKKFYINGQQFYFRGFGRHEDYHIRGKGLDNVHVIKDYNLIKWVGANSYRTSHYPYAEEIMDQADEQGIVIIDESPAVDLTTFDERLLENHKYVMSELIRRDKNRPSVVMWSVANEPSSTQAAAKDYFATLIHLTKKFDRTRAVTYSSAMTTNDKGAPYVDIICLNRYYSWYSDTGHTEVIQLQLVNDLTSWNTKYDKPVMITEYGADTITGMHMSPPFVWTEDYQVMMMNQFFLGFDTLRNDGFFIGEMIWNFADFMTAQSTSRVVGNKKGIFTRERQPKASAHVLRGRYHALASLLDNATAVVEQANMFCPVR